MRVTNSIVNSGQVGYWHFMDTETSTTSNVFEIEGYKLKHPDKTNKKIRRLYDNTGKNFGIH